MTVLAGNREYLGEGHAEDFLFGNLSEHTRMLVILTDRPSRYWPGRWVTVIAGPESSPVCRVILKLSTQTQRDPGTCCERERINSNFKFRGTSESYRPNVAELY